MVARSSRAIACLRLCIQDPKQGLAELHCPAQTGLRPRGDARCGPAQPPLVRVIAYRNLEPVDEVGKR